MSLLDPPRPASKTESPPSCQSVRVKSRIWRPFSARSEIRVVTTPNMSSDQLEFEDSRHDPSHSSDIARRILRARGGCAESLEYLTDRFRRYLLLVANAELDCHIQAKFGASDLVQDALMAAHKGFGRFQGTSEKQLRLWLRRILLNRLATSSRSFLVAAKRDACRERQSPTGLAAERVIDGALTPASSALAAEQALTVERAISGLNERYRKVISWRCFERRSFGEIAVELGMSANAARKLWCRAIEQLRERLPMSDI
jgi:RNA polymerase sigma-70 factor, ECF subfamily